MEGLCLSNVKVHFLPPNLTSVLQPCDAGIIRAFKAHYRKRYLEFAMTDVATEVVSVVRSPIAKDADLEEIVEQTKSTLNKLAQYPSIPGSSKKSRITIDELLSPTSESKLVHDIVPIPSDKEILRAIRQENQEIVQEELEEEQDQDIDDQPERVPWSLTQMKTALNEIQFGLLSQPESKFSGAWLAQIKSIELLQAQIKDAQWSGLKQTTIDSFLTQPQ
ncbi:hypothetical protein PGT21_006087 [Puccinia graminis f. sp. tritici]|uniref:DDE-1 domain-containing protein n=1 Tax=Puccinia graminis f. sp. tritici TaxID=56615 RepID=A0A5B0QZR6_PUCGR|nr:hypothetical protein PGT21_006087 [Puccinia graminis f. sp. tritici]